MEICKFPKLGSNIQSQVSTSLVSKNWNKTPNNIREKDSVARFRTGSREYFAGDLLTYKLVGKIPTRPINFPTSWPMIPH